MSSTMSFSDASWAIAFTELTGHQSFSHGLLAMLPEEQGHLLPFISTAQTISSWKGEGKVIDSGSSRSNVYFLLSLLCGLLTSSPNGHVILYDRVIIFFLIIIITTTENVNIGTLLPWFALFSSIYWLNVTATTLLLLIYLLKYNYCINLSAHLSSYYILYILIIIKHINIKIAK